MTREDHAKYRHELKYLVSTAQLMLLKNRVSHLLAADPHVGESGAYCIRSLYFDDYDNRCYYENENGTDPREKFRIRIYNHSATHIALECKRKERGKTLKTSCPLNAEQVHSLMSGNTLPDLANQPPVLRKLTMGMMQRHLHPVAIVEYDRIPYVYSNGNVRVTFDTNVSSSCAISDFFSESIPKRPIMATGEQLVEVKFDEYLPDYIYRNLQLENLRQTTFSKYYLCRHFELMNKSTRQGVIL